MCIRDRLEDVVNLTTGDELELEKIGEEKTALFIRMPDDNSFHFLAAALITQLFQLMMAQADARSTGKKAGDENPENKWVEGRQYNLSVTLHKTKITVDGCEMCIRDRPRRVILFQGYRPYSERPEKGGKSWEIVILNF